MKFRETGYVWPKQNSLVFTLIKRLIFVTIFWMVKQNSLIFSWIYITDSFPTSWLHSVRVNIVYDIRSLSGLREKRKTHARNPGLSFLRQGFGSTGWLSLKFESYKTHSSGGVTLLEYSFLYYLLWNLCKGIKAMLKFIIHGNLIFLGKVTWLINQYTRGKCLRA